MQDHADLACLRSANGRTCEAVWYAHTVYEAQGKTDVDRSLKMHVFLVATFIPLNQKEVENVKLWVGLAADFLFLQW